MHGRYPLRRPAAKCRSGGHQARTHRRAAAAAAKKYMLRLAAAAVASALAAHMHGQRAEEPAVRVLQQAASEASTAAYPEAS